MIDARLSLALDGGGLLLPDDGRIAVMTPDISARLPGLDPARVEIIEGFKPAYDQWTQAGYSCRVEPGKDYAAVLVCLPRSKVQARSVIAEAMELTKGPVIVDGQKTDGIDSILKEMRARVALLPPISKAHGKLFVCPVPDAGAFAEWRSGPALTDGGFWTAPGVFSADGVDPASALLAQALPERLGGQVVDLGAGWGYLSAHVLTRGDVEAVHLVEAEHIALECARRNVGDARAVFHWADATRWTPSDRIDSVVMNPPFHTSRAADPAIGQAFVQAAARMLAPQGNLWLVANRHLPYEQILKVTFSNVVETGGDARFKLFHASRPKRARRQ